MHRALPQQAHRGRRARAFLIAVITSVSLLLVPAAPTVAKAPYKDLERFALSLVNCTRTGGWVRANGTCKGRGSGTHSAYRKPLKLHGGISSAVARPWAKRIASADHCGHTIGSSDVDGRFRKAGYRHATNGESVGCSSGYTVRQMVIRTHRMMQAEKSYGGWHWRNMKNGDFKSVGVGIAKVGRETRVVYDFYGKKP
ncbi:MAG: hypothetical protein KF809_07980 [Chloroflexi bacterium]|nr:hypothetical protein [Chloroflexota bacterium]